MKITKSVSFDIETFNNVRSFMKLNNLNDFSKVINGIVKNKMNEIETGAEKIACTICNANFSSKVGKCPNCKNEVKK